MIFFKNINKIKRNEKKSLLNNFISFTALQAFSYVVPIILVPYLISRLGIENFGLLSLSSAFVQFFILVADFGISIYGVNVIASNKCNKSYCTKFLINVIGGQFILLVIISMVMLSIIFFVPKFYIYKSIYYLTFLNLIGSVLLPTWLFQGMELIKIYAKISITIKLIAFILIIILVRSKSDLLFVMLINGLSSLIVGIISLYLAFKILDSSFDFSKMSILRIKYVFQKSFGYFLSKLGTSFYTNCNSIFIGLVLGNFSVGLYSAAEKIYIAIQSIYTPIFGSLYPYITKSKNVIFFKKIFLIVNAFNILFVLGLLFFSNYILSIINSSVDEQLVGAYNFFLIAIIVTIPSILLGYPFLGAMGFGFEVNLSTIIPSFCHFISLGILFYLNKVTIINVVAIVVLTEILILVIRIYHVTKVIPHFFHFRFSVANFFKN